MKTVCAKLPSGVSLPMESLSAAGRGVGMALIQGRWARLFPDPGEVGKALPQPGLQVPPP